MSDPDREFADALIAARSERRCLVAATGNAAVAEERAYRIQGFVTDHRLARGERIVGWKLGYTSQAMREQMGIAQPNFGPLTDAMVLESGGTVPDSVIQPKVEPEIALVVSVDVPHAVSAAEAATCVRTANAALEVVDSIWQDYSFSWADNTADGSSAAHVVIGPELPLADLAEQTVTLLRDGAEVARGQGSHAMGNPYAALAWLSEQLAGRARGLRAGDVVITGGLCRAIDLAPGDVVAAQFSSAYVEVRRDSRAGHPGDADGRLGT